MHHHRINQWGISYIKITNIIIVFVFTQSFDDKYLLTLIQRRAKLIYKVMDI